MMPLTFAPIGEEQMIHKVGGNSEVRTHLENLGFVSGGFVTVISTWGEADRRSSPSTMEMACSSSGLDL